MTRTAFYEGLADTHGIRTTRRESKAAHINRMLYFLLYNEVDVLVDFAKWIYFDDPETDE